MKIEYIKTETDTYYHQEAGVQKIGHINDVCYPVCYIKKLFFGRYQIDFFEWKTGESYGLKSDQTPNTRIVVYPSGIKEIKFNFKK